MGRILAYGLEDEPTRAFMDLRMRAVEDHLVFEGDTEEGEFCQRYPHTSVELRGLYSIEDNVLSIFVTGMPDGHTLQVVDDLFERLVRRSRDEGSR